MRFESSFNAADFPAPRPPQTRTLPFRRSVFSRFIEKFIYRNDFTGVVRMAILLRVRDL